MRHRLGSNGAAKVHDEWAAEALRAYKHEDFPAMPIRSVDKPISARGAATSELFERKAAKLGLDLPEFGEWNFMGTLGAGTYGRTFACLLMSARTTF